MRARAIRSVVRLRTDTIAGGRQLHTWNDLLGVFKGLYGVKTGHTGAAGWCEVAAVKRNGVTLYTTVLGSPTRSQRNADLASLLRWGISRYRPVWVVPRGRVYLRAGVGYGKAAVPIVAAQQVARTVRIDRPLVERVIAPNALALPVARGQRVGEVRIYSGRRLVARQPLVTERAVAKPSFGGRLAVLRGQDVQSRGRLVLVIVTVTLNAAIDRTLTVPNFQLGHRHRASQGLTLAGREGHQRRACAQAAGRSGRRDRSGGWANRDAHRRGADVGGDPERLRAHRRRVAHVERGGRPDGGDVHGDQRVGPARRAGGAGDAAREDQLPRARRRHGRVRRGRCRAESRTPSTPRRSAISTGATSRRCSTPKGRRLRLGVEAEAFLVTPNQREAEGLVGQEFGDDEDYMMALDRIADMGARNVLITSEHAELRPLPRRTGSERSFRADAPNVEPVSAVGSGDVLLAAFLAARLAEKPLEESLRAARGGGSRLHARGRSRSLRAARGVEAAELGRRSRARARGRLTSGRGASVTRWESS